MIYTLEEAATNHMGSEMGNQIQADISVREDNRIALFIVTK